MDLTRDLLTLQGLSGDLESFDNFAEIYEKALKRAKNEGDIEQIRQLRKIVYFQFGFMLGQYLKEKIRIRCCEQMGEIQ